jgi:hypothetical protein
MAMAARLAGARQAANHVLSFWCEVKANVRVIDLRDCQRPAAG